MVEEYTQNNFIQRMTDELSKCIILSQLKGYNEEKCLSPDKWTVWNKIQDLKVIFKSLFDIDLNSYKKYKNNLNNSPYKFSSIIYDALFFFAFLYVMLTYVLL